MVTAKQRANLKKEPGITRDNAREMQKKSAEKRKENRTLRQIMEEKLKKRGRKSEIIEQLLLKAETGDLAAFDRVRALLNETDDERKDNESTINLIVGKETARILRELTDNG